MIPFKLHRLCTIMKPEEDNEFEVEGVLNPAVTRGADGELYLFPRLVAKNNYSRIGIAKVIFDEDGDPVDVERMGTVLELTADDEPKYIYSAGTMILSENAPQKILYRSYEPILTPELLDETIGTVGDVVFPTGTNHRDDITTQQN